MPNPRQQELPLTSNEELSLWEPPPELIARLAKLLPRDFVDVRKEGSNIVFPYVFSLALGMIEDALARGHTIDRSNEDGELRDWDGWLVIHAPVKVFIRSNWQPLA